MAEYFYLKNLISQHIGISIQLKIKPLWPNNRYQWSIRFKSENARLK